jgi:DNA replication protein DnaC
MNTAAYQQMASDFRASAKAMMFSNSTADAFLASATPKQIAAVHRMLGIELATRAENKRARLLNKARFPALKSADDFDFTGIQYQDGYGTEELLSLSFIDAAENLVLYGPSGRGKTHLATALGMMACNAGMSVRFFTAADLVYALSRSHKDGTLERLYGQIERTDCVILDEFGYIPFDPEGARLVFQVISKSYENRSLIFTTNIEFSHWGTILSDDKLAAATIDRVVHHGRLIVFKGTNHRMENALMMGKGGDNTPR